MVTPPVFDPPTILPKSSEPEGPPHPPPGYAQPPGVTSNAHLVDARLEFPLKPDERRFDVGKAINQIVNAMYLVHRDITFLTDEDNPSSFSTMAEFTMEENKFQSFFITETITTKTSAKIVVGMRFKSTYTVALFKRSHNFLRYLSDNHAYLYTHKFKTLRLSKLGFIVGKSPILTWRPAYEIKLRTVIANQLQLIDNDEVSEDDIPIFETTTRTLHHTDPEKGSKWSTYAIEIVCEASNVRRLLEILHATRLNARSQGTFVPHHLARTDPTLYRQQLVNQNKYLNQLRMIPVFGLHPDTLAANISQDDDDTTLFQYLKTTVIKQDDHEPFLFQAIEMTNRSFDKGKWFFWSTTRTISRRNIMWTTNSLKSTRCR